MTALDELVSQLISVLGGIQKEIKDKVTHLNPPSSIADDKFGQYMQDAYKTLTGGIPVPSVHDGIEAVAKVYRQSDSSRDYMRGYSMYLQMARHDAKAGKLRIIIDGVADLIIEERVKLKYRDIFNHLTEDDKIAIVKEILGKGGIAPFADASKPQLYATHFEWMVLNYMAKKK